MPDPCKSSPEPLVYAVVPAFNRCELTLRFLRRFSNIAYANKRVVIVDDNSYDGTRYAVELNFSNVPVLRGTGRLWWSGGTNAGVSFALEHGADYVLTINDDALFDPDFLSQMVAIARQDPRYIVGARQMCQDDPGEVWSLGTSMIYRAGEIFRLNYAGRQWEDVRHQVPDPFPVETMAGNGVLLPRAVFEQVGYYDARHMPQYHADSDLVLRARAAGFRPVIALRAVLYNHILEHPLVTNRIDLVLSKKSDRYWRAVYATLKRHGPRGRRVYLLLRQYSPFFLNGRVFGRAKRLVRRLLEGPPPKEKEAIARGYNPTCADGPA